MMRASRMAQGAAGLVLLAAGTAMPARAEGDAARGATAFRQCLPCHALEPARHETGPSLAGIYGRAAGKAEDFERYSDPLAAAGFTWTDEALDRWLANPGTMLPGSRMTWSVADAQVRADLVAYLKALHEGRTEGLAVPKQTVLDLKSLGRAGRVAAIRHCRDTFHITLENGATLPLWERNLRLRIDSSADGPAPNAPALLPGGMHGDRYTVIFRDVAEIGRSVTENCEQR